MSENKLYITQKRASEIMGLPVRHIRKLADEGRVRFTTTPGGHRRYLRADIMRLLDVGMTLALYTSYRSKLRDDIEPVVNLCKENKFEIEIIVVEQDKDVTRALPDRSGFKTILDMARDREIMGFIFVDDVVPNDGLTLTWLVACARLGLYCYRVELNTIQPYPYRVL
jgi:excisionase family DNA binding protein